MYCVCVLDEIYYWVAGKRKFKQHHNHQGLVSAYIEAFFFMWKRIWPHLQKKLDLREWLIFVGAKSLTTFFFYVMAGK